MLDVKPPASTADVYKMLEEAMGCHVRWIAPPTSGVASATRVERNSEPLDIYELQRLSTGGHIMCIPNVEIKYEYVVKTPIKGSVFVSGPVTGEKIFEAVQRQIPVIGIPDIIDGTRTIPLEINDTPLREEEWQPSILIRSNYTSVFVDPTHKRAAASASLGGKGKHVTKRKSSRKSRSRSNKRRSLGRKK